MQLTDYTPRQAAQVFNMPVDEVADAIREGRLPPPDYAESREPRWHKSTIVEFTKRLAINAAP